MTRSKSGTIRYRIHLHNDCLLFLLFNISSAVLCAVTMEVIHVDVACLCSQDAELAATRIEKD